MKTAVGITDKNTQAAANDLMLILADEYDLSTKTRNAHCSINGVEFYEKRKFFETQFGQLDGVVDSIVERIRSFGHRIPSNLKSFLKHTQLTEMRSEKNDASGFIKELLVEHESIIQRMREKNQHFVIDLRDASTGDFIAKIIEIHEKMARFLHSQLQK